MESKIQHPPTTQPLSPLLVGVAMFLFFPLGLYLLWRHPTLGKNGKWWAAGIAWGVAVMFMASREENSPKTTAEAEITAVEPTGSRTSAPVARKKRKPPAIKDVPKDAKSQDAYKAGWEQGVSLAFDILDDIDSRANGQSAKAYLKAHPDAGASLEEQRMSIIHQFGQANKDKVRAYSSVTSRGVAANLADHPEIVQAEYAVNFAMGKQGGFLAVINPLLFDK
jgi:hypothetical protein